MPAGLRESASGSLITAELMKPCTTGTRVDTGVTSLG